MTQRPNDSGRQGGAVGVYDDNNDDRNTVPLREERPMYNRPTSGGGQDVSMNVVTPSDRVRWPAILAGIFTALTTGILLTLAALAFGLNQFTPGASAQDFGIGAIITSAIIWLLSFGLGGYVAGRTGAFPGRSNGLFNGLMVGMVGIPLLLWAVTGALGSLLGTVGAVAGTAAQTAGQAAANPSAGAAASGAAQSASASASAAASAVQGQLNQLQDPQTQEQIADTARNTALGSLAPLSLALGAAATGGAMGARKPEEDQVDVRTS